MKILSFIALSLLIASPFASAQLASPNTAGVGVGHVHILVPDPAPVEKALMALGGGSPLKMNALDFIPFPGVFVIVAKGNSNGGTVGSVLNHIGFEVKNIAESTSKWEAAGIKVEMGHAGQAWLTLPGEIRVEILEDPKLDKPVKFHHIHLFTASAFDAQAWYGKIFGAVPMKRSPNFEDADVPGAIVRFTKVDTTGAPTKGRVTDHIGFEVANLDEFAKKLEAQGIKLDVAVRTVPNHDLKIAFFTDPWGTYIELTQGLEKAAK